MDAQPPDVDILHILDLLNNGDAEVRREGVESLRTLSAGTHDARLVEKLQALAGHDSNAAVREAAASILQAWGLDRIETAASAGKPPLTPIPTAIKRRDFIIGLVGWYVVNSALFFILGGGSNVIDSGAVCFVLPGNLIALIVLAVMRSTRWFALGILTAIALNFIVTLFTGALINGICFIPFFFDTGIYGGL